MVALCANLNCDFEYILSDASINDQMLSGTTLTVFGSNLPVTDDVKINLGPVECIPSSSSATEIVCELEHQAVTGSWIVEVHTAMGIIPNVITFNIIISASVSAVSPNAEINFLGGDLLTIDGDNFGYDASVIDVEFGDGTTCNVLAAQMTFIECEANRWTATATTTQKVTVTINSVQD